MDKTDCRTLLWHVDQLRNEAMEIHLKNLVCYWKHIWSWGLTPAAAAAADDNIDDFV
jgi:hypothetical protein